jgi:flagellar biosynthesis/type III secretory pathway protein FliH
MGLPTPRAFTLSAVLQKNSNRTGFSSKQFAANRAGFLLREYARQGIAPSADNTQAGGLSQGLNIALQADPNNTDAVTAEHLDGQKNQELRRQETLAALTVQVPEFSAQGVAEQVNSAYQDGRNAALHEMQSAIDQAMIALASAADALATRYQELEQQLIVPVAKSGVELAGILARRQLAKPEILQAYLEQVLSSLSAHESTDVISVRMNPSDYQLLSGSLPAQTSLKLVEDAQVAAGGVLVSGGDQVIDDRFERRLREVQEAALAIAADVLRDQAS